MKRLFVAVVLTLLGVCPAFADYGPPLNLPNREFAADPMVLEVDSVYYLYPTTTSTTVECWTSADLESWEYAAEVMGPKAPGSWNQFNVWAPEVHPDDDGAYYLYYAANMRIGVAKADNPLGSFVDVFDHPFVGDGYNGVDGLAIDAHVFRDDDGQRYFYFAGYSPFSSIHAAKMISMTELSPEPHRVVETPGIVNWEMFVCEGPWMVKHADRYYLMYSGYGADRPNYAVGCTVADEPLGEFYECADNPILHRDDAAGFYGPGHNSTAVAPDGQLQIVYHTKTEVTVGWDRKVRINDLCFTDAGRMYVGFDGCVEQDPPADDDQAPGGDDDDDDDSAPPAADRNRGEDDDGCGA
jgi:beta-xylosidase